MGVKNRLRSHGTSETASPSDIVAEVTAALSLASHGVGVGQDGQLQVDINRFRRSGSKLPYVIVLGTRYVRLGPINAREW